MLGVRFGAKKLDRDQRTFPHLQLLLDKLLSQFGFQTHLGCHKEICSLDQFGAEQQQVKPKLHTNTTSSSSITLCVSLFYMHLDV